MLQRTELSLEWHYSARNLVWKALGQQRGRRRRHLSGLSEQFCPAHPRFLALAGPGPGRRRACGGGAMRANGLVLAVLAAAVATTCALQTRDASQLR